ncbi:MAG TPA: alpha/beta fold hydrolase [Thermoanaerobaculia bacterium]|nr:alpha/beta fold hydrolase [Thermoanaerobaculia bacterium]
MAGSPPLHSFRTRVGGLSLHARASAPPSAIGGRPVVLVHGYGISGRYMLPIARRLAAEMPVFIPDLPGHGRSEKPADPFDIPELAEALRAWMDAVGIRRAALLGNSMGCQVVAELALRHPERVDRIVLVGPTLAPELRKLGRLLPRFLWTGWWESKPLIPLVIWDFLRAGPRQLITELRAVLADPVEEKMPRIAVPALVLRGAHDHIVPQRWAEEAAHSLRTAGLLVVPGAGHALNYSAPDELLRRVRPFLLDSRI